MRRWRRTVITYIVMQPGDLRELTGKLKSHSLREESCLRARVQDSVPVPMASGSAGSWFRLTPPPGKHDVSFDGICLNPDFSVLPFPPALSLTFLPVLPPLSFPPSLSLLPSLPPSLPPSLLPPSFFLLNTF